MPLINTVGSFAYIKANFVSAISNVAAFWDLPYSGTRFFYTQSYNSTTQEHKVVYSKQTSNQLAIFTINSPTNTNSAVDNIGSIVIGSNTWLPTPLDVSYKTLSGGSTVAITGNLLHQNTSAYASLICSFDSNNLVSANTYNVVTVGNVASSIGQGAVSYRNILLNTDSTKIALGIHNFGVGTGPGNSYSGMIKIDSTTNEVWQKNYTFADSGPNLGQSSFWSGKLDSSTGNFYTTGYVIPNANTSNTRTFVTKFDSDGNILWQRATPNAVVSTNDTDVTFDTDYAYFLAPRTNGNIEIFKLHSSNGITAASTKLTVVGSGTGFPSIEYLNGNILINYQDNTSNPRKSILVNMSTSLSVNWSTSFTGNLSGGIGAQNGLSFNDMSFDTVSTVDSYILGGYMYVNGNTSPTTLRIPEDGSIPGNGVYTMTNYYTANTPTLTYATLSVGTTATTFALSAANGTMATATNPVNTYTITLTPSTGQMGYVNLGT